ncbi:hypothetical protein D3C76_1683980 [compost metagenome]
MIPTPIPPINRAMYRIERVSPTANIRSDTTVSSNPAISIGFRPRRSESCPPTGEKINCAAPKAAIRYPAAAPAALNCFKYSGRMGITIP